MRSAVLVIDVQRGLFDGSPRPYLADEVIRNINNVTEYARTSNIPVVFIQHEKISTTLEYGTEGWQLQSDLIVSEHDIFIRKTTPDSFLKTNLEETLKKIGVTNLLVCGYASEFCVDTTIRRAGGLGYSIELIADAHTTHDKNHATALQIREHHNATLPNITSFSMSISTVNASDVTFRVNK